MVAPSLRSIASELVPSLSAYEAKRRTVMVTTVERWALRVERKIERRQRLDA
jgi:hypothetical protein